jgi:hypothetical protein
MMGVTTKYEITRTEVDRLALEWCKAKHVVVMLDDVARNFARDIANKVLRDFVQSIAEIQAAKKAAATGEPAPAAAPAATPTKPSIILTD